MKWQDTENEVKRIASYIWNRSAVSETIAGIKCDCVVKKEADFWCIIEITQEQTLDKLRTDIAKLFTVKNALSVQNIYAKCYFIMEKTPTDSIRNSGQSQNIDVMAIDEFRQIYFDYPSYKYIRNQKHFGSLIDVNTGLPENTKYISVKYIVKKTGEKVNVEDITKMLLKKKKVILKGNFGTGKSRCVKQIFDILSESSEKNLNYPIAINLRDHWGARYASEILIRHFTDISIEYTNFMKTYENEKVIYLLDGFDEIGTQTWSDDPKKMHHIRAASVVAIKDLVEKSLGGVLITGREHFFNSDKEMINCFGADDENIIILECNDEFSDAEIMDFFKQTHSTEMKNDITIPDWLPKRPLIMQLVLRYAAELFYDNYEVNDVCDFWHLFFNKLCIRESKIDLSLNPDNIKRILIEVGRITRTKINDVGPITINELSSAFENVVGFPPNDESSIMLQRLPGLGRVEADSPDRQFLDSFILNGLRAEDIIQSIDNNVRDVMNEVWKNPIDVNGCTIISEYIQKDAVRFNSFLAYARQAAVKNNTIIVADIISSLLLCNVTQIDFKDMFIADSHFTSLFCQDKQINNLTITDSIIELIDITNAGFLDNANISNCVISNLIGIPSEKGLPKQIDNNTIEKFQTISTVSRIKKANLLASQKVFVTIIKKIFFQPGSGRKEEALLRGLNESANKRFAEKIINKLIDEGIILKIKGDEGFVYVPVRKFTGQLEKILAQLTLSNDQLWDYISKL